MQGKRADSGRTDCRSLRGQSHRTTQCGRSYPLKESLRLLDRSLHFPLVRLGLQARLFTPR